MIDADTLERLQRALNPISKETEAEAAVAVLLKPFNRELQVLFIKRVENSTDPWSGQIALPGGKHDANDLDLQQTVTREVMEETNIDVLDHCRFLGTLAIQRSTPRPDMRILPFVIVVEYEPAIKLSRREIVSCAWIALEELQKHQSIAKRNGRNVNAYIINDYVIWGTTYRILENLIQILKR